MNVTIDDAGRVVIPKPLREKLGVESGAIFDAYDRDGTIVLEPRGTPMQLVRRGKGWAAEPERPLPALTAAQVRETLEKVRR